MHDIDQGFESDSHPGVIIHDSRGFQGGCDEEVNLLKKFIKKHSSMANPADRLDAIWYGLKVHACQRNSTNHCARLCIETDSTRMIHKAEEHFFRAIDKYAANATVVI